MITGKTKLVGILGWPLGHSLSPIMHNAAFEALHLDYVYVPLPVPPDDLPQAVAGLKAFGFVGANVTIPHKVAIIPYLDELDFSAQLVGAVNTIVIKNGKCIGYNTDAQGFIQSLTAKYVTITDGAAVILGAGGAARAVVSGLITNGIRHITIGARDAVKAKEFVDLFPKNTNIQCCNWHESFFADQVRQCDILINCTPIGMSSHMEAQLPIDCKDLKTNAAVCDLIYNPPLTQLLASAKSRGHIIINGTGMLLEQGLLAFELWTGEFGPRQVMSEIVAKYL